MKLTIPTIIFKNNYISIEFQFAKFKCINSSENESQMKITNSL